MEPHSRPESLLEKMMRFTPAAVSLAVVFAITSSGTMGQKPNPLDPRSIQWSERGGAALAAGKLDDATDAFETSLALDPRNRGAFIGLAQVAHAQGLPGKEIRFYDEALLLDPQDVNVLHAQGTAMLARGAVESARGNLAKIKTVCKKGCDAANRLARAITTNVPAPRMVSTTDLKAVPSDAPVKE
jgi:tetratricopeptide (TPR) repeat protein